MVGSTYRIPTPHTSQFDLPLCPHIHLRSIYYAPITGQYRALEGFNGIELAVTDQTGVFGVFSGLYWAIGGVWYRKTILIQLKGSVRVLCG